MAKWVCFLYFCPLCLFPTSDDVLPFSSVKVLFYFLFFFHHMTALASMLYALESQRRREERRTKDSRPHLFACTFAFTSKTKTTFYFSFRICFSQDKKLVEDQKDQLVWRFFTHFHTSSR